MFKRINLDEMRSYFLSDFRTVNTDYDFIRLMCVLADNSVVICGKIQNDWKLTQYNQENGAEVFGRWSKDLIAAHGVALVRLTGKQCLAFSYG